jgi:hypothetical protein
MRFIRVISCSLIFLIAVAAAEEKQGNQYSKPPIQIDNQNDPPPPVSKHRGLKIALGVLGGVAVFGAIIGIAVANSASNNQTGYNDWGTLALTRH